MQQTGWPIVVYSALLLLLVEFALIYFICFAYNKNANIFKTDPSKIIKITPNRIDYRRLLCFAAASRRVCLNIFYFICL